MVSAVWGQADNYTVRLRVTDTGGRTADTSVSVMVVPGMVHYQGNRFHPGLGRDHQLVTPVEFLAMLVPHIALRYEVRIRT